MTNIEKKIKESSKTIELINSIISENFFGQEKVAEQVLTCLLSSGNTLLVGVPGLGKTLLFQTLSDVLGLEKNRIQCTPDLMPSDILGVEVLSSKKMTEFTFVEGPIFCNLLMVDEINRASPKTQSALLQAMEEGFISVNGKNIVLPKPFIVLATQNPIEQEGTYNLPEAQLDRFLMHINITYPDLETEKRIISNQSTNLTKKTSFNPKQLINIINLIKNIPVGESVFNFTTKLIRNLRPETSKFDFVKKYVKWGPGPRGGIALISAAKSRSLIKGTFAPSISDVISLAKPCLRHRISLNFEAKTEEFFPDDFIKKVSENIS